MVVTKYSLIGAILQYYPSAEQCFNEMGMHCVSCHMSPRETLEQHSWILSSQLLPAFLTCTGINKSYLFLPILL